MCNNSNPIVYDMIGWLNALERIPKQIEQSQTENTKLKNDYPFLRWDQF